jgi:hypothetical protein
MDSQKLEALARQLGELEREANEVAAAIQRSGSVRRLVALAIVVVVGVISYLGYQRAKEFVGKENMDLLSIELNLAATNNADDVMKQLWTLVENTRPTVIKALNDQFSRDMPAILAKLGTERDNLAVNLQSRLESHLRGQYNQALEGHRAILREEFKIEDEETLSLMIHHFEGGFQPLVERYYGKKLKAEFERMYALWDEFPIDDSQRTREELEKELYNHLVGLFLEKVSAVGSETAATGAGASGG